MVNKIEIIFQGLPLPAANSRANSLHRAESKQEEKQEKTPETFWMELNLLNQKILDDITSIYCQVYNVTPEKIKDNPDLESVAGELLTSPGLYERNIAGGSGPALEVRRIELDKSGPAGMLIRFKSSRHPKSNDFQEAVDSFLSDHLKVAKPLSQVLFER